MKQYNISIEWEYEDGGRFWVGCLFATQEEMDAHIFHTLEKGGISLSDIDYPADAEKAPWL